MEKFTKLKVWQRSHTLVLALYKDTREFPERERFCLVPQIRRAAISIAANIAEGSKRRSDKEYVQFLYIAQGSLEEVKYYLRLCNDLLYIDNEGYEYLYTIAEEIGRLLHGFIKKLKECNP